MNFVPKRLYIGGEWVPGIRGETFESINPSNSETLGEVPCAGVKNVDQAVKAAKNAFPERSRMPLKARAWCRARMARPAREAVSAACYEGTQITGFRYTHLLNPVIQRMSASGPGCVKTIFEARARNIDSRNCRRRQ
ncbi:MAG: aldehyde dehydrogenase family protein [Alphaproteobacteria bacterium]|nr:aldehyde dehydrogenase family protein [Alphaproteobacteria bacterium]